MLGWEKGKGLSHPKIKVTDTPLHGPLSSRFKETFVLVLVDGGETGRIWPY